MIWQYIIVGIILIAVVVGIIVKTVSKKNTVDNGNPYCAGCALARNCKKRRRRNTSDEDCHVDG